MPAEIEAYELSVVEIALAVFTLNEAIDPSAMSLSILGVSESANDCQVTRGNETITTFPSFDLDSALGLDDAEAELLANIVNITAPNNDNNKPLRTLEITI